MMTLAYMHWAKNLYNLAHPSADILNELGCVGPS